MGKITEALKRVTDDRVARIQRKPETQYVVRKLEDTNIDAHIVSFHDSSSPIAEQYKIVRTNLQTLRAEKGYKSFALTSAINGEGKTVTTLNLAISVAHDLDHKSVLLIDADMRKGKLAQYLGIERSPGLSDVLKGEVQAEDIIVSPNIDNLSVIVSGKMPKNPAELLGSKKMKSLLTSLKNKFDYIFIDTPPVMPLTDACTLGSLVDGVVLVIQASRTQRGVVKHALGRLYQAHAKTLGYIMTNIEYHLPHYLYRYVQEYGGYKYAYKDEDGNGGKKKKVSQVSR
ncbi:MAG: CpsD/CapB family tyrosine-protein kinase [Candidatus Omnitrophica bacterium]|nr:CpsD/CapB family tyrosine-protein kinase [Candidatus Omnitrophota bacterium]